MIEGTGKHCGDDGGGGGDGNGRDSSDGGNKMEKQTT